MHTTSYSHLPGRTAATRSAPLSTRLDTMTPPNDSRLFRRMWMAMVAVSVAFALLWGARERLGLWSPADDAARAERKADKNGNFWQRDAAGAATPRLRRVQLALKGLACGTCNKTVLRALRGVPGVWRVNVRYTNGDAVVDYDPTTASLEALLDAPTKAGYPASTWSVGHWLP